MKSCFRHILLLISLSTATSLFAQTEPTRIILNCKGPSTGPIPLYVFKIANREWSVASTPNKINPDWIKSLNVLANPSDISKYGKDGKNGVIIIEVKDNYKRKMLAAIRRDVGVSLN